MNSNTQLSSRTQSGIEAGSLTAQWLLWGLPESLGLAAPHGGRGEMVCPPQQTGLALIKIAA